LEALERMVEDSDHLSKLEGLTPLTSTRDQLSNSTTLNEGQENTLKSEVKQDAEEEKRSRLFSYAAALISAAR